MLIGEILPTQSLQDRQADVRQYSEGKKSEGVRNIDFEKLLDKEMKKECAK